MTDIIFVARIFLDRFSYIGECGTIRAKDTVSLLRMGFRTYPSKKQLTRLHDAVQKQHAGKTATALLVIFKECELPEHFSDAFVSYLLGLGFVEAAAS